MLPDGLISDVELVARFLVVLRGERVEHLFKRAAADDLDLGGSSGLRHVELRNGERERGNEAGGQKFHPNALTS